ncbi:NAD-dependent epimerase/dehydratase family protein [Pseudomonas sp. S3_F07]
MKLLITGATGYIGQRLSVLAAASGHEVVCATRQPCPATYTWLPYDLRGPAPEFPAGTQVLIHLAADTSTSADADADDEIKAAQALIRCAQQGSARFIFISSQTAEATAPGVYGRTKWRIEQHVLAAGGSVIRPGQVYGGPERGLFGLLSGLVRRSPFIPILMPAPGVQPIHVDDLAASILAVVERDDLHAEILNLGAVQPIAFGRFLMSIAAHRVRAARLPVPLPVALLRLLRLSLGQSLSAKLGLERIFPSSTCRPWTANVPCRNSASGCAPLPTACIAPAMGNVVGFCKKPRCSCTTCSNARRKKAWSVATPGRWNVRAKPDPSFIHAC